MEQILSRFGDVNGAGQDDTGEAGGERLWRALVDRLRPGRAAEAGRAGENLRTLTGILQRRDDLRVKLLQSVERLFRERKVVSLYVSSGLLPSSGFFSETARRLSGRVLPEIVDTSSMRGVLGTVFNRVSDEIWVNQIDDEQWVAFLEVLFGPAGDGLCAAGADLPGAVVEVIEALRILAYHVSSIGLDPELVRIDATLEEHESPFMAQNAELVLYLAHYHAAWSDPAAPVEDEKHLAVMLDLLCHLRTERSVVSIAPQITRLLKELTRAECRKNKLTDYWSKNLELIAGYYDNLAAYGRIPERLKQLRLPRRLFGEARMDRLSDYVESNLGALAGNFFFGFLLGGVTALGVLFGLPLDIRHIAFSSAYVGHALVGLQFELPWQLALGVGVGVVLIGLTNLAVSFALTLSVAMRARRITFAQGQDLLRLLFARLLRNPGDFVRAPRR